jgi:hypothetical protein
LHDKVQAMQPWEKSSTNSTEIEPTLPRIQYVPHFTTSSCPLFAVPSVPGIARIIARRSLS